LDEDGEGRGDTQTKAQGIVERQEREIEQLRRRVADDQFARELRAALTLASVANTVAAPVTHDRLLEIIVETAAQVISARAGSLLLLDESSHELVFEVALGGKAEEVEKFRVPVGHGIAGLVALTGQPIAVSDAESDPRQASDIAGKIGYHPSSLLCVPLYYGDRVTGVLELLDKEGAATFTPRDMELLGRFAELAGVAIAQSSAQQRGAAVIERVVQSSTASPERRRELLDAAESLTHSQHGAVDAYGEALEVARLVHDIVSRGPAASRAVQTLLQGFVQYLDATAHARTAGEGR